MFYRPFISAIRKRTLKLFVSSTTGDIRRYRKTFDILTVYTSIRFRSIRNFNCTRRYGEVILRLCYEFWLLKVLMLCLIWTKNIFDSSYRPVAVHFWTQASLINFQRVTCIQRLPIIFDSLSFIDYLPLKIIHTILNITVQGSMQGKGYITCVLMDSSI